MTINEMGRPFITWRLTRAFLAISVFIAGLSLVSAQELEPRAYVNTPIDMNFLLVGVGYSQGNLLFDPSVPIQGADAKVDIGLLGYVHSFTIAGRSAKFGVLLPYGRLNAAGDVDGTYQERKVSGLADPVFLLDEDRLLNLGTNRWSIKPEVGISKALDKWVVEGAAGVSFYTTNDAFFGGQTLKQDPIYSLQAHVVYNFAGGWWAAVDATYYTGGVTTVEGVPKDNRLDNWRAGATIAAPIDRHHSLKLAASSGVYTRTGTDFDVYLLVWQYRWGGGL